MKYLFIVGGVFGMLLISGCKKDNHSAATSFSYQSAVGIWVPYALVVDGVPSDGATLDNTARFKANSIFANFAESVQLNADKSFIPVQWTDSNNFILFPNEAGTFEYVEGNELLFSGNRTWRANIVKFQKDDLWMAMHVPKFYIGPGTSEYLYKFKRLH